MLLQRLLKISFGILVIVAIASRFIQYEVKEDFLIYSTDACDPASGSVCFIADCEESDPECDLTPYKKIHFLSQNAPGCLLDFSCEEFVCSEETNCAEEYCSEDVLEEGELCLENSI